MQKVLTLFVTWSMLTKQLPKDQRYSLGIKISTLFTDVIEQVSLAQFSTDQYRPIYIDRAIAKNDTLKFMVYALYELRSIDDAKFAPFAFSAEEVGKMLYGWKRSLETKNTNKKTPA